VTLLPWGFLTDRIGERIVLATGLGACGLLLVVAGQAQTFWQLYLLLFLAGAAGASVNAATGRAVMGWFDASQRGLALGIRQAAVPVGGLVGAFVLPQLTVHHAYAFLGVLCVVGATAGAIFLREPTAFPLEVSDVEWTLRDHRLWRLCLVAGLYVVAQMAILSFVALYLHDERSLSKGHAAAVLGAVQVAAMMMRVGAGQWSDKLGTRIVPLARIGIAMSVSLAVVTALLNAPLLLLVPAFVVAGSLTMAWNGVAFAAVAELAGRARSCSALGVQQTVLSLAGVATPLAFAAAVSSGSWSLAYGLAAVFPIAGWLVLRTLAEPEAARPA
jgi:MFS family permease